MMSPAMNATLPQNIPQTTQLLLDMKNKGQLQSYVAQHKDDPGYASLLSLAMTINQTSDEAKALAAQPPQQTISNQALASLASRQQPMAMPQAMPYGMPGQPQQAPQEQPPEMSGIAQAPAPNMQHMADGGIVGYAEGGHIDSHGAIRFQNLGSVPNTVTSAADLRNILNLNGEYPITTSAADLPNSSYKMTPSGVQPTPNTNVVNKAKMPLGRYGAGLGLLYSAVAPPSEDEMASLRAEYNALPAEEKARRENPGTDGSIRHLITSMFSPNKPTTGPTPPAISTPANTAPSAEATGPMPTALTIPELPTKPYEPKQMGIPGLLNTKSTTAADAIKTANQFLNTSEIQQGYVDEKQALLDGLKANEQARKDMVANRPNLGKRQEERLDKDEKRDINRAEDLKNFSLIDAGLAMMSGTSPYAMANIGQGGLKGLQSYKEGLKDLDKAKDARDQLRGHIEDMRDAQTIGDQNATQNATENAFNAVHTFNTHALNAQTSLSVARSGLASGVYEKGQDIAAGNARTNLMAGIEVAKANFAAMQPPDAIRTAQWLGNGDIKKGMELVQTLSVDKTGSSFVTALEKINADRESKGLPTRTMDDFLAGLRQYTAATKPPNVVNTTNPGSVLSRPGM
jgi:hypothetical protein